MIEWLGTSYFSFMEGSSSPEDLVLEALRCEYQGIGIADRMGLYGCVEALRAIESSEAKGRLFYAPGIRLHFDHAEPVFIFPLHKAAHSRLCQFLSTWALQGLESFEKGLTPIPWRNFKQFLEENRSSIKGDFVIIWTLGRFYPWPEKERTQNSRVSTQDINNAGASFATSPTLQGQMPFSLLELAEICGRNDDSALSLMWPLNLAPGFQDLLQWIAEASLQLRIPVIASSAPLYASKADNELNQTVAAIRHSRRINDLGYFAAVNSERRLLSRAERLWHEKIWKQNFQTLNNPFLRGQELAQRHHFSLHELKYRYPTEKIPSHHSSQSYLRELTYRGALQRYPQGIPHNIEEQIQKELNLIAELQYEDYFLTIYDVLEYAREKEILYQGRGSAANSIVCFCLGITAVDPSSASLLFERFLSKERHEPPDIDIDFEHERREEVLQEIYKRYGRNRAAMVANVIRFRGRMALREAGKALGLSNEQISSVGHFAGREGLAPLDPNKVPNSIDLSLSTWRQLIRLASKLKYLPRHLGIHSCGFVLSADDLRNECILEPARKENRSVVPWNKDDIDYLGWMKVDLLSLGMLSAIRKCFDLIGERNFSGKRLNFMSIPQDDPSTYQMIRRADTVGVFQIESRAQMSMLPRLRPKNLYDLVIQVAIVRPGPLQGGMVHPFLKRRQGLEKTTYPHPKLIPILEKTSGVPIFQEQVMRMAVAVADFTPGEADQMRKVMSGAWRSKSQMSQLRERLIRGMIRNGLTQDYAERIYKQMEGFGEYGFPESHAASFALITYVSCWLKAQHPAEFLCALLNSQPMGFYSPRALVGDAQRHGVKVLPIDIFHSQHFSSLEFNEANKAQVRLGLHLVRGLSQSEIELVEKLQKTVLRKGESSLQDLRTHLSMSTLQKLIKANACRSLAQEHSESRPAQLWELWGLRDAHPQTQKWHFEDKVPDMTSLWSQWQSLMADYQNVGLSLSHKGDFKNHHPASFAREKFFQEDGPWINAETLWTLENRRQVRVLGLLSVKQRPPTAGGMCFLTLEDESGFVNVVIKSQIYERDRLILNSASLLAVEGHLERSHLHDKNDPKSYTLNLIAHKLWNPFENLLKKTAKKDLKQSLFQPRNYH